MKVIKLNSGVEAGIKEMVGKHQRILTKTDGRSMTSKLDEILLDCIVYLGDTKALSIQDIQNMLTCDKEKALIEIRHLTMGADEPFEFTFEYLSEKTKKKEKYHLKVEFDPEDEDKGFPVTLVKRYNKKAELVTANYKNYSDIQKDFEFEMKSSGKIVKFSMLDGNGEKRGEQIKKNDRSSHSPLIMRNPRELRENKTSDGKVTKTYISLNLDKTSFKDLKQLREEIYKVEGRVDKELAFNHPETHEAVYQDILGTVAFFFPSEKI